MKYALILLLLLSSPVFAQDKPAPEARPFSGDVKTLNLAPKKDDKLVAKVRHQPNVEIWLPPEFQATENKWPLLIFSHGFGGCAKQSEFLTSYLADQGYIVIAPDHADAKCSQYFKGGLTGLRSGTKDWPERPFRSPEKWDDKTEADRRDDVLFALSSMLDDRRYKNYIDLDKVGLIGHSLGGYTVLGIAGGWKSWKDKRFKAVLALSPFVTPYSSRNRLKNIDVPVMYQGGTRDNSITPEVKRGGGAYAQTKTPKYFVELDGADHFAWTDMNTKYQDVIRRTALAFCDKYVKGEKIDIDTGKDRQIRTFWKAEE